MEKLKINYLILCSLLIPTFSFSAITLQISHGKKKEKVVLHQVIEREGKSFFSLKEIAPFFSAHITKDLASETLTYLTKNDKINFSPYSNQILVGKSVFTFPVSPFYKNGTFYVPVEFLTQIYPKLSSLKYSIVHLQSTKEEEEETPTPFSKNSILVERNFNKISRIVIDPGHGGEDTGAKNENKSEKEITLEIALELQKKLKSDLPLEVLMTRTKDEFISLDQRIKFANDNKADLFVSIHLNASHLKSIRGSEVYFLSAHASDDFAESTVEKENSFYSNAKTISFSGSIANIIQDIEQTEAISESSLFADILQDKMSKTSSLPSRGIKQAPFFVLMGAKMPAILFEVGYITNSEDFNWLTEKNNYPAIAKAIIESIQQFQVQDPSQKESNVTTKTKFSKAK